MARRRLRVVAVAACIAAVSIDVTSPPARAQTPQELDDARKLFGEALRDEQEKRFDAAIDKFRRVQRVRDTLSVRYRIAACSEGLGKLIDARTAFAAIAEAGATATGDDVETARSAAARVDDIGARLPRLTVRISARASNPEVRIDERVVPIESLTSSILLDPGEHVVDATGDGAPPYRTRVRLDERAKIELTLPLDPPGAPPVPSASAPPGGGGGGLWGTVALGAGGVLVGASVITFLLRHGDIAELERSCTNGVCPAARQSELTTVRNRALVEGPLAIGFGAAGLAAAGVGLYLTLSAPSATPSRGGLSLFVGADGVVRLRGSF